MMPFESTPGSSSALARMIFTVVFLSSGRLDRASRVAGSTGAPNPGGGPPAGRPPAPPGGGPNDASGPPGCPSVRPGSAPADDIAAPPGSPQVLPESARIDIGFGPDTIGGT